MEPPLGTLSSHGASQLTQGMPAVCRRRVNRRAGGECIWALEFMGNTLCDKEAAGCRQEIRN